MAIAGASLGGEMLTATQALYTFPAVDTWTPVSGELCLIIVMNRKGTAADAVTSLTGTGGFLVTWTAVATETTASDLVRTTLFRGVPSSGTGGAIAVSFGITNQLQCGVQVTSFSGVDTTTNQGVVQSATGAGSTGGALAATLAAFADAANATYLGGVARGGPTAFVPEASYTGYYVDEGVAGLASEWIATNDTSPTGDFTSGSNWCCVGAELDSAAVASGWGPLLGRARNRLVVA